MNTRKKFAWFPKAVIQTGNIDMFGGEIEYLTSLIWLKFYYTDDSGKKWI